MPVRPRENPPITSPPQNRQLSELPATERANCRAISQSLRAAGLYQAPSSSSRPETFPTTFNNAHARRPPTWRISPEPFWLTAAEVDFFQQLGSHLLAFYQAVNQLYHASRKGLQPAWVCHYFDQGKPDTVRDHGRMNRFKQQLPGVIRPDMIPITGGAGGLAGMVITELDAVPGGIGLTAALGQIYCDVRADRDPPVHLVGGRDGMIEGFSAMLRSTAQRHLPGSDTLVVAIVVSDESQDYRAEMRWLAEQLRGDDLCAVMVEPDDIRLTEPHLECLVDGQWRRIDLLYRFFELFDLQNVPKSDLMLYSAKKRLVAMTPPPKSYLEEKLVFALFHHPVLRRFWESALPGDTLALLRTLVPPTWIVDPRPLPPHAVIPGLSVDDEVVSSWTQVANASQRGRHLVLKPSGFSPLAWGSRGVAVGHDLSQEAWIEAMARALGSFDETPYVLQPFLSGRPSTMSYWNLATDRMEKMDGRVRLSPYYFVTDEEIRLGGILATLCPMDKKLLHGMSDAILAPCAVSTDDAEPAR